MEQEKIKQLVLSLNKTLREKYNTDIIFSGSLALYLQGIELNRDFHDIDVKVVDVDPKVVRKNHIDFELPIDFLGYTDITLESKEIDVDGQKILVYTPETIMKHKVSSINFNRHRKIKNELTERKVEKDLRDLRYITENYGIGNEILKEVQDE